MICSSHFGAPWPENNAIIKTAICDKKRTPTRTHESTKSNVLPLYQDFSFFVKDEQKSIFICNKYHLATARDSLDSEYS